LLSPWFLSSCCCFPTSSILPPLLLLCDEIVTRVRFYLRPTFFFFPCPFGSSTTFN
jgi:hypothetical protein